MGSLLKSTRNTRALPTGTLRYIRSDYPGNLLDEEVSWLRKNGVTTIIDLREKTEYAQKPCRLETESGFTYYHLPVTGGGGVPESPESVADAYLKMIDGQMERIICVILKAESNVLYFCGAGKDRTGVVSAILLKQLDHRGLHENEGQPVGLPESVRCGASRGKHSYHSPKRGEYKKGFGCPFPNRGKKEGRL